MSNPGLVLAGGGARGAYEAGVLSYIFVDGPPELREMARFRVLCGTSIGALNVCATAASIHQPAVGIRRLVELWRNLKLEDILQLGLRDLRSLIGWATGKSDRASLFPGEPVHKFISEAIDWDRIHINLGEGHIDAVTLSCTQVTTGKTVVFYETGDGKPRRLSRDPHVKPIQCRLNIAHATASAAIPFVFPAVSIDNIPYCDGGLRQNTPLSPALRLGSDRLLVVGLGHDKSESPDLPVATERWRRHLSSPVFLLAKVLNALMLDHVDYDLIRLRHMNQILEDGEKAFGSQFVRRLNAIATPVRGANYRRIPTLVLRPSQDLGMLAADHVRNGTLRGSLLGTKKLVQTLAMMEPEHEADLTSYLLFDGGYCEKLISLGYEDAARCRDQLLRFFEEDPQKLVTHTPGPIAPVG